MTRSSRAAVVAGAVLLAALGVPAHAAISQRQPRSSPSFAGYQVTKANRTVTEASARFTAPTTTCKRRLGAVGPAVLVQTRADRNGAVSESGAGIGVTCRGRTPAYDAVVIVNGQQSTGYALTPGDRVVATVTVTATESVVRLSDLTSGEDKTSTGSGNVGAVALIGDSALGPAAPSVGIDPFTKTVFAAAKVNRRPIGRQSPQRVRRTAGRSVQIAVGKLHRQRSFALTFKHSR